MWRVKEVTKEEEEWILANLYYDESSVSCIRCNYNSKNGRRHIGDEIFTCINEAGYYQGSVLKRIHAASRVVYFLLHNVWVDYVKHLDGNPLNNKRDNLIRVDKPRRDNNVQFDNVPRPRGAESPMVWQDCFTAQPRKLHSCSGLSCG